MNFMIKVAVVAAALAASAAASADTFDFSYSFADGEQVTGQLDGTLSGTTITNISNISVALNGTAFDGGAAPLSLYSWNGSAPVVFSTVGSQNNFAIGDDDPVYGNTDYLFSFANDAGLAAYYGAGITSAVSATNYMVSDSNGINPLATDVPANGSWAVTPVPVPAALPLLLSGLGLFGAARRRAA